MAFLDNSGDIILDAVLTDEGRKRLARGDGSFKIVKFALGDDEIDYALYNTATGSAYMDLKILQTPILEAFTHSRASLKHTLLTIGDRDLFYLPSIKLNEVRSSDIVRHADGVYYLAANKTTEDKFNKDHTGIMYGANPSAKTSHIEVNQGLDAIALSPTSPLSSELVATQYKIEVPIDLAVPISPTSNQQAPLSYVTAEGVGVYFLTSATDKAFISTNTNTESDVSTEAIRGPRGTDLRFRLQVATNATDSAPYIERGSTKSLTCIGGTASFRTLDTTVRVTDVTNGGVLDVPITLIRAV
tara:strand:+ start:2315 stop:3217 length:903 start_codon:yes stop_codon:yes gene_type:complete